MNSAAMQGGCKRGRHQSNPDKSQRGRGGDSQDSSLDEDPLTLDAEAESADDDEDSGLGNQRFENKKEDKGLGESLDGEDNDDDDDNASDDDNVKAELRRRLDSMDDGDNDGSRSGRAYELYGHEHSGAPSGIGRRPLTTRTAVPTSGRTSSGRKESGSSRHNRDNNRYHRREHEDLEQQRDLPTGSSRRRTRG